VLTIRHVRDDLVTRIEPASLKRALRASGFVWIDLAAPTADEEAILDGPGLDIEPMALENMREHVHLPKLDVFDDEALLTVHAIDLEPSAVELRTIELDIVLKRKLIVTWHRTEVPAVTAVGERLDLAMDAPDRVGELLYRILDVMTDVLVPFVDYLDRRLDLIEEDILGTPTQATRREIYQLQRDVIQLRRVVVPQAEVIRRLGREAVGVIDRQDTALFNDVYDHLYRVTGLSDSYHQLLSSALDNYRSALNDETNKMFKVLTLFSAMLLPVTFIAGIYGMNFTFMPELDEKWGYWAALGLMAAIILGELVWFRRKGWIGGRAEEDAEARRARREAVERIEIPVLDKVIRAPAYGARAITRAGVKVGRGLGRLVRRRRR